MACQKEARNRTVSVNSTKQITAAMKMVSAAKLRRAQDAIIRMRPYAEKLGVLLSNVSASLDGNVNCPEIPISDVYTSALYIPLRRDSGSSVASKDRRDGRMTK